MKRPSLSPAPHPRLPFICLLLLLGLAGPGMALLPARTPDPVDPLVAAESIPVLKAIANGDLPALQAALAEEPALWSDTTSRQVLFVHACREGRPELVNWMLDRGASPDLASNRETPLDAAAGWTVQITRERRQANPEFLKLALTGNAQGAPSLPQKLTPEQAEAFGPEAQRRIFAPLPPDLLARKADVIALLLPALGPGSNPARLGPSANRIVSEAVLSGFGAEIIERLIRAGASPRAGSGSLNFTPLHTAVITGNAAVAATLLSHGADLESLTRPWGNDQTGMLIGRGGNTPLMAAIVYRQPTLVQLLLEHGANVETSNATMDRALHFAATLGDPAILRLILAQEPRIGVRDRWQVTPLHYAASNGRLDAAKLLLAAKADLEAADEAGFTPLLSAAENNRLDVVKYLLENGASRRARTDFGKGPLRVAATSNALAVAAYLIESGEKVDGDSSDAMRPLHEAASSGHPAMVTLLLEHGATTKVRDRAWQGTPLLASVMARSDSLRKKLAATWPSKSSYGSPPPAGPQFLEIIRLLAEHGADVNAADRNGNTALHFAVEHRDREAVELLHSLHARHDLLNNDQRTAIDVALATNQPELAEFLRTSAPQAAE